MKGELVRTGQLKVPYSGILDVLCRIVQEEGVWGLWRGNLPNCLVYVPTTLLNFYLRDFLMSLAKYDPKKATPLQRYLASLCSGGLAGLGSLAAVYSLHFARGRLGADVKIDGAHQFSNMMDVYRQTLKTEGFFSLYSGFLANCIGMVTYRGAYFGLYDSFKPLLDKYVLPKEENTQKWVEKFIFYWCVSILAGYITFPLSTLSRRMAMNVLLPAGQYRYTSTLDALISITREEGVTALFQGADANILRSIVSPLALTAYNSIHDYIYPPPPGHH